MSNIHAEETGFAKELVKILNRQYSRHHFDSIVQRFIDQALKKSSYTLLPSQDDAQVCMWAHVPEFDDCNDWETSCGHTFTLTDGTPAENGMKFCLYCGKRLAVDE